MKIENINQEHKVLCHFCGSDMARFVVNGSVFYKCRNEKCGHSFCGGLLENENRRNDM